MIGRPTYRLRGQLRGWSRGHGDGGGVEFGWERTGDGRERMERRTRPHTNAGFTFRVSITYGMCTRDLAV